MRKILGQRAGTGALVTLYGPPANRQATVSTLAMLNTTSAQQTVRITAAIAGVDDTPSQTLHLEILQPGERVSYTEGITLGPLDLLRVNTAAGVNVHAFGSEIAS